MSAAPTDQERRNWCSHIVSQSIQMTSIDCSGIPDLEGVNRCLGWVQEGRHCLEHMLHSDAVRPYESMIHSLNVAIAAHHSVECRLVLRGDLLSARVTDRAAEPVVEGGWNNGPESVDFVTGEVPASVIGSDEDAEGVKVEEDDIFF